MDFDELCEFADDEAAPEFEEPREPPEFGCCFPDECCMPGLHFPSECHTAADYA